MLTTTSNSTLDADALAFLVLQHNTYHRCVGNLGFITASAAVSLLRWQPTCKTHTSSRGRGKAMGDALLHRRPLGVKRTFIAVSAACSRQEPPLYL